MDLTKLKPFDRQAAKQGAKLVTREGKEVIYYHDSGLDIKYPIVAYVQGQNVGHFWLSNGRVYESEEHFYDLFIVRQTREYWAFKYRDKSVIRIASTFSSQEDALVNVDLYKYEIIGEPFCYHIEEI